MHTSTSDRLVTSALGLTFLFYFVARGWLSAALVLIGLYCFIQSFRSSARISWTENKGLLWVTLAFSLPLIATGIVEISHGEFVPRYFEMPARFLLAGVIMLYLAQRRVNFVKTAEIVFPLASLLCAGAVYLTPGAVAFYWDGRVATSFIDPLTLSQHVTIVGFICLFSVDAMGRDKLWLRTLKYAGVAAAVAVALGTQSRTGWTMVPILTGVWLIGLKRHNSAKGIFATLLFIVAGCSVLYFSSDIVKMRVDKAVIEVYGYFHGGDKDTSLGIRLSLFRTNWLFFWERPLFGWGFQALPSLSENPEIAKLATPLFQKFFIHSGGHNELLQSMMRMGIFGLVSRLALFLIPFVFFAHAARSALPIRRACGYFGLAVVIGYLTAGLTSEVFNLIYAASFYALIVAALAAGTVAEHPNEQA